jgi:hypothetical protein
MDVNTATYSRGLASNSLRIFANCVVYLLSPATIAPRCLFFLLTLLAPDIFTVYIIWFREPLYQSFLEAQHRLCSCRLMTYVQNGPSNRLSAVCPTGKLPLGISLPLFSKNTPLTPFNPCSLGVAISLSEVNAAGT